MHVPFVELVVGAYRYCHRVEVEECNYCLDRSPQLNYYTVADFEIITVGVNHDRDDAHDVLPRSLRAGQA